MKKHYRYFLRKWVNTDTWEISRYQTDEDSEIYIPANTIDSYRWNGSPNHETIGITPYKTMRDWIRNNENASGVDVKEISKEEANEICREEYNKRMCR